MHSIHASVRPYLLSVMQLKEIAGAAAATPDQVRTQLLSALEQSVAAARAQGLDAEQADHLRYALVAFTDELMQRPESGVREYWAGHTMQLQLYGEGLAGEGFFKRVELLRKDPTRVRNDQAYRAVLYAYLLCLLFGFQGKFGVRGQELELMRLTEGLTQELAQGGGFEPSAPLAPEGPRPHEPAADARRNGLLQLAAGCAVMLAFFVCAGLYLTASTQAERLEVQLENAREALR